MSLTVECGYCKQTVSVAADAIGRCVVCSSCGWMLAVVAAIPAPAAPPPPPADARSVPTDRFPTTSCELFRQVLTILQSTMALSLIFGTVLFVATLVAAFSPTHAPLAAVVLLGAAGLHALLYVVHLTGQVMASGPLAKAGVWHGTASCVLAILSPAALVSCLILGQWWLGVVGTTLLVVVSFGMWVEALTQLGESLGDGPLEKAAARYLSRYVSVTIVSVVLTGMALANQGADGQLVPWVMVIQSALSLLLGYAYWRLLGMAVASIRKYTAVARLADGAGANIPELDPEDVPRQ